jgi:hypothetical protein
MQPGGLDVLITKSELSSIARQRLISQGLVGARFKTPSAVVRWLGAVQSQDYPGAKWGVATRMNGMSDLELDVAFNAGQIVRTHMMRPTWHFVTPQDLRWILALTSPRVHIMNGPVYRRGELDDALFRRAQHVITRTLVGGRSATRAELAKALESKRISAKGLRLAYIVMQAELAGLICSGPLRGKQHTYMLVEERVPPARTYTRDESLAMLAERYFTSHGPATVHDFSWWSGLTVADSKRATQLLDRKLDSLELGGKTYWLSAAAPEVDVQSPTVHLLPNYDEHVVAYRDHGPSLDPRTPHALQGWGNALTAHLVVVNGLVVGGWRRALESTHVVLRLALPIPLRKTEMTALKREAEAFGKFLGLPVRFSEPC